MIIAESFQVAASLQLVSFVKMHLNKYYVFHSDKLS